MGVAVQTSVILYSFSPATDLYKALTRGALGGGRFLTEEGYAAFYQHITTNALVPGLDFLFNFSLGFLVVIFAFRLGMLERFRSMLLLSPVCAGLKYINYLLVPHPMYFALFAGVFTVFAAVMAPIVMRFRFRYK
jgi:hypothetical protein